MKSILINPKRLRISIRLSDDLLDIDNDNNFVLQTVNSE